ncbi:5-keto-D-gluconate 5-reductase [Salmonella enterica subsp. enterica serovar Baildon str. R6-199]|nr:5-keto-D-gluconate 5-reductase [Salmonella enterica subsp. enterica serovar Baildon str. R6-199]
MNDLFSLAGKNILITGAAQGIGYLLATGLGRYGARIMWSWSLWCAHYYC